MLTLSNAWNGNDVKYRIQGKLCQNYMCEHRLESGSGPSVITPINCFTKKFIGMQIYSIFRSHFQVLRGSNFCFFSCFEKHISYTAKFDQK